MSFPASADLIGLLAKAERERTLRERIRFDCRPALLIVDEIGYLPVVPSGGNLFFQLVNARYEKSAMILTSNRGFAEWGKSSEARWSRRRFWTGCFITPSSFRSQVPAIGCVATQPCCPSPFYQTSPSPGVAAAHPKTEVPATKPADP